MSVLGPCGVTVSYITATEKKIYISKLKLINVLFFVRKKTDSLMQHGVYVFLCF